MSKRRHPSMLEFPETRSRRKRKKMEEDAADENLETEARPENTHSDEEDPEKFGQNQE